MPTCATARDGCPLSWRLAYLRRPMDVCNYCSVLAHPRCAQRTLVKACLPLNLKQATNEACVCSVLFYGMTTDAKSRSWNQQVLLPLAWVRRDAAPHSLRTRNEVFNRLSTKKHYIFFGVLSFLLWTTPFFPSLAVALSERSAFPFFSLAAGASGSPTFPFFRFPTA